MANFAVAASPETIEKANKIMEIYAQNGDKKEIASNLFAAFHKKKIYSL